MAGSVDELQALANAIDVIETCIPFGGKLHAWEGSDRDRGRYFTAIDMPSGPPSNWLRDANDKMAVCSGPSLRSALLALADRLTTPRPTGDELRVWSVLLPSGKSIVQSATSAERAGRAALLVLGRSMASGVALYDSGLASERACFSIDGGGELRVERFRGRIVNGNG